MREKICVREEVIEYWLLLLPPVCRRKTRVCVGISDARRVGETERKRDNHVDTTTLQLYMSARARVAKPHDDNLTGMLCYLPVMVLNMGISLILLCTLLGSAPVGETKNRNGR